MIPNGVWSLPDLVIVALFFALFASLGLLIPRLGQRLYGRVANEPETRLVDRTQRGLRAFLVFLLALTLNDVREKFVRMDAEASREAGRSSSCTGSWRSMPRPKPDGKESCYEIMPGQSPRMNGGPWGRSPRRFPPGRMKFSRSCVVWRNKRRWPPRAAGGTCCGLG